MNLGKCIIKNLIKYVMERKQNAIKFAWENLVGYENVGKLRIDENGWCNHQCRQYMPKQFFENLSSKLRPFKTKEPSGMDLLYRPKSLNGIENNNGWNRIDNVKDLPETVGNYTFLVDGREVLGWHEVGVMFPKNYTHWRNYTEFPRPLY